MRAVDPEPTDWAYLAGLIDGEGCISATPHRNGKNYNCRLSIVNTDRRALEWVVYTFEVGRVLVRNKNKVKPCFKVQVANARDLGWVLQGVLPYLLIKREQALLAIERTLGTEPARQREIYMELIGLKR